MAFGLSTDYAVFLLSRIKEAHDAGLGTKESVAIGLQRTGRIVTAAALLFAVAIGAFATSEITLIKELGVGTALAVLIDATIIRALLGALADGAARRLELVGAAPAAPLPRAVRLLGVRPPGVRPGAGRGVAPAPGRSIEGPGRRRAPPTSAYAGAEERDSRPSSRARATASARVATPSLR